MDILTMLAWIAFAVAATYLIRFVFESFAIMALAISMSMSRTDGQNVNKINLGARPLWSFLAATVVGIVLLNL